MNYYGLILAIWAVMLVAAFPYVRRIKHPEQHTLAAYLIFITLFTVGVFLLFNLLIWLLGGLDLGMSLDHPLVAGIFLILVFVPSLLLARWQTRKPPIRKLPS